MIQFKENFFARYSKITDFDKFMEYSQKYPRRAIRVNTIKISAEELQNKLCDWELDQIPWCREGFWITHKKKERRDVGNLPEHSLGYFYVQESVSMIPPIVLDPGPGEMVLDMSAAPGSKATQMAAMMQNKGVLVANDYKGKRLAPLGQNIQRMGITNTVISLMHGQRIEGVYDKILLDAPCSGTGTIRKSPKTLQIWNPLMIERLAKTQKQLIKQASECLNPGGTLVYSTCSIDPQENEEVVDWLLQLGGFEVLQIELSINRSRAITEFGRSYSQEVKKCLRIWPQDNDTEGFFVAHIKKR